MRYRVLRVPYRRVDGSLVPVGSEFDATDRERSRIQRRGHVGTFLEIVSGGETAGQGGAAEGDGEWPSRMPPHQYLRLHPTGRLAPLARQVLGITEDDEKEPERDEKEPEGESQTETEPPKEATADAPDEPS